MYPPYIAMPELRDAMFDEKVYEQLSIDIMQCVNRYLSEEVHLIDEHDQQVIRLLYEGVNIDGDDSNASMQQ
jgi:hypothetical protein